MRKMYGLLMVVFLLLTLTVSAQAVDVPDEGGAITMTGIVVIMDDGIYVDGGELMFLLVDMEDPQLEGFTIEVTGEYLVIDDQPAIKVQDISVLEDRAAGEAPQDSSQTNN